MSHRTHLVYRAFDGFGLLLYVGCTEYPEKRWVQHRANSAWFPYAETIATWPKRGYYKALAEERQAIKDERPFFNAGPLDQSHASKSLHAANREMNARGRGYSGDHASLTHEESLAWYAERDRIRQALRSQYPYTTPADRLARYLAAREAAAQERAA